MNDLDAGGLRIVVESTPTSVQLKWRGRSVERRPATTLGPFFETVLAELGDRRLMIDFREFEFMNSSTVRPIIEFLRSASEVAKAIEVYYHGGITWQRLSFKVVEALAKEWDNVSFSS